MVEFSLVAISINAFMNDNEQMWISAGKKEEKLTEKLRIGSALRQGEVKPLSTATAPCGGLAPIFTLDDVMPPVDRCSICGWYFWWFRRDSLYVTPKASSTICHNIEIFHVLLSNLTLS